MTFATEIGHRPAFQLWSWQPLLAVGWVGSDQTAKTTVTEMLSC
jgi:hypothetical protein